MNFIKPIIEGYQKESKNCTVVALCVSTRIPYQQCLEISKKAGRKPKKGFRSEKLIDFFNKNSKEQFVPVKLRKPITIQKFCKRYSKGSFFARKRGHAFAIVDGDVFDMQGEATPRSIVKNAWKLKKVSYN
jgi:hypothetical protein